MFWAEPTGVEGASPTTNARCWNACRGPRGAICPALRRLQKRGLVEITSRVARRAPRTNPAPDRVVEPTQAQADALAAIEAAPGQGHLLHGVTGSGKTEVYLRAAAAALERGEGVIVLVPEIALTPQTVARFAARFGDTVGGAALRLERGRALRRVAPPAHGRGADRRRPALGGLRPGPAPRPDRRRRGARRLLQAGERPALRRPPRRRLPRLPVRRPAAGRLRHPAPRDRPPDEAPAPADARGRRARSPPGEGVGHARRAALAAPRDAARARRHPQVDRPAQPARMVELPHLPLVREGVGVPELRRRAGPAPRRERARLPPLRSPRARPAAAATPAARCRWRATARAPSAWRPS